MRMGTRSLVTIACPRPASVGARTAPIIAACQMVRLVNRSAAMAAPAAIVSGRPIISRRAGNSAFTLNNEMLIRDASVNRTSTRAMVPTSSRNSVLSDELTTCEAPSNMPAAMNAIGAVTSSLSTRRETSANPKTIAAKIANSVSNIAVVSPQRCAPIEVLLLRRCRDSSSLEPTKT